MNRKAKYAVGIVIVVLSLSLPHVLQAQGELSLESIAERVENLFTGQTALQSRVAAIETRLAPTPTRKVRPTGTPTRTPRPKVGSTATARAKAVATTFATNATATARARYRATQVAQADARSTRQTKATATEQAKSQLSQVEYLEIFTEQAELVTMAMEGLTMSFRNPQPSNSNWLELLNVWLETFPYVQQIIVDLVPPSSLKRGHDTFLRGIAYCVSGAELIAEGVKNLESSKFTEAADDFDECTRITSEALTIVGR